VTDAPDVSIIVVSWNTRELLLACLRSVERVCESDALAVELIVVDNGSSDGTAAAVAERFPAATRIALPHNVGFAAGCNAGIRRASARHLLLLNSDTELREGVLAKCVAHLDANPDIGIVGPRLLHADGSVQNSIHSFPIVATELIPKGVFEFLFPARFPSRRTSGAEPLDVEALLGAALFVRHGVVDQVGPLCEDYFFFLEETDWCWRFRAAGWRVVHFPSAEVVHVSGASSKKKNAALTRIEYHRSLYRFYRNHRGFLSTGLVLLLRSAKSLFYVVSQAPLALAGARHRARWHSHWQVLMWHLRGCPARVGVAQLHESDDSGGPDIGDGHDANAVGGMTGG
jgi:hypothetical protein